MRRRLIDRLPLKGRRRAQLERLLSDIPRPRELARLDDYRLGRDHHRLLAKQEFTMLSSARGRALYALAADARRAGVPGALVDCGVWNGGSTVLLSLGAPGREVWAFDSFEGLPAPDIRDGAVSAQYEGACVGSEARLRDSFARFADASRLNVCPGWFEETFPRAAASIASIAVLHVDGDWYESVRLTLETFFPKVSSGGYIVIDDYGTWPGARAATDSFRQHLANEGRLHRIDHTGYFWQKRRGGS
jgi:hypothetical protein